MIGTVYASLQRVGIDHIGLLQLHGQDFNAPGRRDAFYAGSTRARWKVRYIAPHIARAVI